MEASSETSVDEANDLIGSDVLKSICTSSWREETDVPLKLDSGVFDKNLALGDNCSAGPRISERALCALTCHDMNRNETENKQDGLQRKLLGMGIGRGKDGDGLQKPRGRGDVQRLKEEFLEQPFVRHQCEQHQPMQQAQQAKQFRKRQRHQQVQQPKQKQQLRHQRQGHQRQGQQSSVQTPLTFGVSTLQDGKGPYQQLLQRRQKSEHARGQEQFIREVGGAKELLYLTSEGTSTTVLGTFQAPVRSTSPAVAARLTQTRRSSTTAVAIERRNLSGSAVVTVAGGTGAGNSGHLQISDRPCHRWKVETTSASNIPPPPAEDGRGIGGMDSSSAAWNRNANRDGVRLSPSEGAPWNFEGGIHAAGYMSIGDASGRISRGSESAYRQSPDGERRCIRCYGKLGEDCGAFQSLLCPVCLRVEVRAAELHFSDERSTGSVDDRMKAHRNDSVYGNMSGGQEVWSERRRFSARSDCASGSIVGGQEDSQPDEASRVVSCWQYPSCSWKGCLSDLPQHLLCHDPWPPLTASTVPHKP